ncbi:YfbM family protein [Paenibacillus sp. GCM10027626]|uniref:YfbM family protein n=1 Tax=Paenibacillus sp. GCM10027626 TaxID=3273411 RepID=UPI00362EC661
MGMIGCYVALDEKEINQLASAEIKLEDLDPYDREKLDIDKSWEAIHYMLCGDISDGEPPFGYIVPLGNDNYLEFAEFGAFYLKPEQVAEGYQAIKPLTRSDCLALYNFEAMLKDEVYPLFSGDEESGDQFFDYIFSYLEQIRNYFEKAVAAGQGIVFYIF